MNKFPLVSVIIVTRNRPQYLKECLRYLKEQDYDNFEIIIVDSSTNQESKKIIDNYPEVKYVRFFNGRNMAVSRNIGINKAEGEIIAFIDDDCYVEDGWLEEIVRGFSNDKIGGVGGRVIDEYRSMYTDDISKVGRIYPNGMLSGFLDYNAERPIFVDYMPGGNMGVRKEILIELGGFDPIFQEWDDVDISMRIKNIGYHLLSNPKARLQHKIAKREFIDRSRKNFWSQYIYNRNHSYCLFKNNGFKLPYFKTLFYWKFISILKSRYSNSLIKKLVLAFAQLWGSIIGLLLAIRFKIAREKDFLKGSHEVKRVL